MARATRPCTEAILGVLFPPAKVFRKSGFSSELWISILLSLTFFGGVIYSFHLDEMDFKTNICCCFIPPLAIYLSHDKCDSDVLICLVLMMFFLVPGIIWAYHKA